MDTKLLIYGFGVSGISAAKTLRAMNYDFDVYDKKNILELVETAKANGLADIKMINRMEQLNMDQYNLMIKSPGILLTDEIVLQAIRKKVKVTNDVEFAYHLGKDLFTIGVTGTNGKTTTTILIGEMIKNAFGQSIVTGNVGSGIMWDYYNAKDGDYAVIELSSFQLDSILDFRSNVSVITNITPDHINWHGNYEKYIQAKMNIFRNQTESDCCVLNFDNEIIREYTSTVRCKKYYFSTKVQGLKGIYVENGKIYLHVSKKVMLCYVQDIFMPGKHNLENVLAASLATYLAGVNIDIIRETIKSFKGVEHRLEFVDSVNGIDFYNDSKGTNTDASIKAILSFNRPIHIVLGGYDKGEDYNGLVSLFKDKVASVSLLGETADLIANTLQSHHFIRYSKVDSMEEAVNTCFNQAENGHVILLSPACASWGMYKDYTERGKDFKNIVAKLVKRYGQ